MVIRHNSSKSNRGVGFKGRLLTTVDKFPEERDPTNDEIEVVIGLVGDLRESPPKKELSKLLEFTQQNN